MNEQDRKSYIAWYTNPNKFWGLGADARAISNDVPYTIASGTWGLISDLVVLAGEVLEETE